LGVRTILGDPKVGSLGVDDVLAPSVAAI